MSLSFCGEILTKRLRATASIPDILSALAAAPSARSYLAFAVARMAMIRASRRKFAELMSDHVLGTVHRDKLVAVMDRKRQRDHVRRYHRAPRPSPDNSLIARRRSHVHLFLQMGIDEGTFLLRSHLIFTAL